MSQKQINIEALRAHADKGWDENCLLPKNTVRLIADELEALRAELLSAAGGNPPTESTGEPK